MFSDLSRVIEQVVKERGVNREVIIQALEAAVLTAARNKLGLDYELEASFNEDLGEVEIFKFREVVEVVEDEKKQIALDDAHVLDPESDIGDSIGEKVDFKDFGRISAQRAKQVIIQRVRDAEKDIIYNEYKDRKGEIVNGIVRRFEKGNIIVDLGRAEGILYQKDQIPRETYQPGDRIRCYIQDIVKSSNSPQIILSRSSPEFLKKLFEMEVPEIYEGIVKIVAAAREPGGRAKVAVTSSDANVDPVGACVGMKGSRVQSVVNELKGEKIDIITYSENPAKYVCNALAPAEITKVIIDEENRSMNIIVTDDQLSLAIGKRGQNVRMAAMLTGWKLDIQSETKLKEIEEKARKMYLRLPMVTPSQSDLLIRRGYTTLEDVADAQVEDLLDLPGMDEERAQELIDTANNIFDTGEWPLPEPEDDVLFVESALDALESELGESTEHTSVEQFKEQKSEQTDLPTSVEEPEEFGDDRTLEDILSEIPPELLAIQGLSPRVAASLVQAGFNTIEAIVKADSLTLAEAAQIAVALAERIKKAASEL